MYFLPRVPVRNTSWSDLSSTTAEGSDNSSTDLNLTKMPELGLRALKFSSCLDSKSSSSQKHTRLAPASTIGTRATVSSSAKHRPSRATKHLPPLLSAKAWSIVDLDTGDLLWGKNEMEAREIASLTKIMTALVVCRLSHQIDALWAQVVCISAKASKMAGTSARLRRGDKVTVEDLMYGLMLPSGNDAALALAEHIGALLISTQCGSTLRPSSRHRGSNKQPSASDSEKRFVRAMNSIANQIGLRNTIFTNPHGLSQRSNQSTAADVGKLASVALQDHVFSKVVNTSRYMCIVEAADGLPRSIEYINTNKLLALGYEGVKTGVTPPAGPCLCSSMRKGCYQLVAVVLAARSVEQRFIEVPRLLNWAWTTLEAFGAFSSSLAESHRPKRLSNFISRDF
eukprot:GILJ01007448.1.p1 GENE.GILJ01007448.1~~GILJ01007448.1.p1  ORF type:complete len:398 (+),score=27.19 GILJ01007448.1:103-1296(+)